MELSMCTEPQLRLYLGYYPDKNNKGCYGLLMVMMFLWGYLPHTITHPSRPKNEGKGEEQEKKEELGTRKRKTVKTEKERDG